MRATLIYAAGDVRVEDVPDAALREPTDALVRVLRACICGSDLWPYGSMGNLAAIMLDSGIGAGLVCEGRLVTGSGGMAGEIGHMRVVDPGVRCICGRTGCLATVASGRRILADVKGVLGPETPANPRLVDLEGLHPKVDRILADAARWLGMAAGWLVTAVAPKVLVLGGTSFTSGSTLFFTEFREAVLRHCLLPYDDLSIVLSDLEGRSDLRGALRAAQERLPQTLAPPRALVPLPGVAAA